MNRDDIIRMAREAGLHLYVNDVTEEPYASTLQRFANLVAAAEREACAKVADEWQTEVNDPRYQCDCAAAIRDRGININSENVNISMSIEEMAKKLRNNK
jgi:hypothetical protein